MISAATGVPFSPNASVAITAITAEHMPPYYPSLRPIFPALNLDVNGKPLTYRSAKNGPDRLVWKRAEADELIRLLDSQTIVPIKYCDIPEDRLGDIVYYNPVVKQKRNDDGSIKYRVRGNAGGDRLTVPLKPLKC
jgi:hypothetical protein